MPTFIERVNKRQMCKCSLSRLKPSVLHSAIIMTIIQQNKKDPPIAMYITQAEVHSVQMCYLRFHTLYVMLSHSAGFLLERQSSHMHSVTASLIETGEMEKI